MVPCLYLNHGTMLLSLVPNQADGRALSLIGADRPDDFQGSS
jgi:hypothetical protein